MKRQCIFFALILSFLLVSCLSHEENVFNGSVITPVAVPPEGTYNAAQTVTLTTATEGATIHYTLDGSVPALSSARYYDPIIITETTTLKAIAAKSGMANSGVLSVKYVINPAAPPGANPVVTPVAVPPGETYDAAQTVTLTTATDSAKIYYTVDGSIPSSSSIPYYGPIIITETTTLKAIAVKSGMANSGVLSVGYVINPTVPPDVNPVETPVAVPSGGTYNAIQTVALTSATVGAEIRYTLDGSVPVSSSALYSGPITIIETTTLKAIAIKSGMANSSVFSANYVINLAGEPKPQASWGTLTANIPNNLGNTFTADPKTTRTITWQSTLNKGEVIIGSTIYPSSSTSSGGYYFHRVDINGLTPGKTYNYVAGSTGYYSPSYQFTTESGSYSDGFYVIHVTDPQLGTTNNANDAVVWERVMDSAVQTCPQAAFVVNTGDMVDGKEADIPYYFDYAQHRIGNYAFIYSMGNNDTQTWYNKYFYTYASTHGGILYSFDYGNVHFINIDSNVTLTTAQLTWLENDLKNTTKKWKVAMTHQGDYGRSGSDTSITKLFDKYNVDLVMAGHNHFYARTKPIDTKGNDKANGTVWSIPNTAGTKFNSTSGGKYLAVDKQPNLQMFSEFKFTETNIYLKAYTVNSSGVADLYDEYTFR